jgi:cytoskeletal protein CcmA (bactofilin family)
MFGSSNKSSNNSGIKSGATIFAKNTSIIGKVDTADSVHIDGKFDGEITSQEAVTIGIDGEVRGEIHAERLVVSGFFDGKLDCDIVEILPGGRVLGQIFYKELIIERKGSFEGEGKIKSNSPILEQKSLNAEKENIEEVEVS